MAETENRREAIKRRIAELNKKHCKTAKELQAILDEIVDLQTQSIHQSIAAAIVECMSRFAVAGTPIDTGRARAAWFVTGEKSETGWTPPQIARPKGSKGILPEFAQLIQKNIPDITKLSEADIIYVVNNVEYILALNAGWSKQQPAGFIDNFLNELQVMLSAMARGEKWA